MILLRLVQRSRKGLRASVAILAGLVLSMQAAGAQSSRQEPLVIPKLAGPIELDGRIEEPVWAQALSLPLVQMIPSFRAEPSERTEVLVGYTEHYLYAACRCYDRGTPSVSSFMRDHTGWDDVFGLLLDTFNDNENGLGFFTTPAGLRLDVAVANDMAGDRVYDPSWNTAWDAAVVEYDDGWSAEIRIPISSLRFQIEGGRVVMGLTATRFIPRKNEVAVFPAIPPEWGNLSHMKPSQAQDVVFRDLEPRTPLRVTPYILAGLGQQAVLNAAETAYHRESERTYDAGLDLKYGLTGNLTLDLTVNTDFAQVEADDEQVNLSRFPLFFPEKRQFFLERASTFAFDFGGPNRRFYSRRIGLHEGQQVRIL
ncbi:MAG: carbohydrate binding family 9 domain-containing protein, partial [Actinomycetota bacterium]|nr:carbohydrate binding family 9 domain-containing protein [Actinomycetota bacterium]